MSAHFKSVTLVDCPPVGNGHYKFSSGIYFLNGNIDSGKASIAMALRNEVWPLHTKFADKLDRRL